MTDVDETCANEQTPNARRREQLLMLDVDDRRPQSEETIDRRAAIVADEHEESARLQERGGLAHQHGGIRHVLNRLEARDQAEAPDRPQIRPEDVVLDQLRDASFGCGDRRARRLDTADAGETRVKQLAEKRALAGPDVQRPAAIRQVFDQRPEGLAVGAGGEPSLDRAVERGCVVGAGEYLRRGDGAGIDKVAGRARQEAQPHVFRTFPGSERIRVERPGIEPLRGKHVAVVRRAADRARTSRQLAEERVEHA